jgi:ANTAR domain
LDAHAEERIRQLQTALETRVVIEQAKGVLAERFGLSVEDAFGLLRDAARTGRIPLRALAENVVQEPSVTPAQVGASLARSERWRRDPVAPLPLRAPGGGPPDTAAFAPQARLETSPLASS